LSKPAVVGGDTHYTNGEYFKDPHRHSEDASFKADQFLQLLSRSLSPVHTQIDSYVDVGSGSGDATRIVARGLRDLGCHLVSAKGYDVSPHVRQLERVDDVEFVNADFCQSDEQADLVTLFDVIEHVLDPIGFIKQVARRCRIIGFHIPLDDSVNAAMRDLFRSKVKDPGHLIFMDGVSALNLLAMAGVRVVDYQYTMAFGAPSGRASWFARLITPARIVAASLSPWFLSKTFGGVSLMVVALTANGLRTVSAASSGMAHSE
jgi:SAM-dependent methyltransferase